MQQPEDTATIDLPFTNPPTAKAEALTLVRLDDVEAKPQIRTHTGMSDAELDELAASIQAQGLMQPPLLRWDESISKWVIVAGHRRIAAMRRAGFETFYAITGTADDRQAFYMQLAENIHRTQLSTRELAAAVRGLFDEHKKLAKVAELVKKSKPWVSKHLAVTLPEFSKVAREMLLNGECEDLETLGMINQLEKLGAHEAIETLRAEPPVTRAKVRAALKKAKANESEPEEDEGKSTDLTDTEVNEPPKQNSPRLQNVFDAIDDTIGTLQDNEAGELTPEEYALTHITSYINEGDPELGQKLQVLLRLCIEIRG